MKTIKKALQLSTSIFDRVVNILEQARGNVVRAVNSSMVTAYWLIGREIVEEIQKGKRRAGYGEQVVEKLSRQLSVRFGRGFSTPVLWNFRQFYLAYQDRLPILFPVGRESGTTEKILSPTGRELTPLRKRILKRHRIFYGTRKCVSVKPLPHISLQRKWAAQRFWFLLLSPPFIAHGMTTLNLMLILRDGNSFPKTDWPPEDAGRGIYVYKSDATAPQLFYHWRDARTLIMFQDGVR
jgi:hypothetical protein